MLDQVAHLASHIEEGFGNREMTDLVLIDDSAAYDTVWHRWLILKQTHGSHDSEAY